MAELPRADFLHLFPAAGNFISWDKQWEHLLEMVHLLAVLKDIASLLIFYSLPSL